MRVMSVLHTSLLAIIVFGLPTAVLWAAVQMVSPDFLFWAKFLGLLAIAACLFVGCFLVWDSAYDALMRKWKLWKRSL